MITGKTTIYQAPALPENIINTVIGMCPSYFNCGRDAVNPAGALAFQFFSGAIATFLRTHSYPAFSTESTASLMEMNLLLAGHTTFRAPTTATAEGPVSNYPASEFSRTLLEIERPQADVDMEESEHIQAIRNNRGLITTNAVDAVTRAKPCPVPQMNIGSRSQAPVLPGILFPYFHGLVQPDAVFLHSTAITHFFQLMGGNVQDCQSFFLKFKRGCGSLSTTKEGMIITHLLKGITLALQTQTRCYMIYEANEYQGFVLYGAQFIIFDSTKWIVPGGEAEITHALARMDPHEAAVGQLVQMFQELKATNQYIGVDVTRATFSEPNNLIDVFAGLDISRVDDAVVKEIDKYLRGLNYMGDGYWTRNPQTIVEALHIITSEGQVELTRPTYIASIRLPIHTREYIALSKFGPESISFWNEKGSEILCKPSEKQVVSSGKRKAGEIDLYANMPDKIYVTPKPLGIAVNDMVKVKSKGAIKIDLGERAGRFRNICVESEAMRKAMWKELVGVSAGAHSQKRVKVMDTEQETDFDALFASLTG